MCANADHSQMRMGPTDAECTIACIGVHDATYVLYDGKDVYTLSDQRTPEKVRGTESEGRRHAGRQDQDDPRGLDNSRQVTTDPRLPQR